MLKFNEVKDIKELAKLADNIWHEYWTVILSPKQIDYMIENFQSEKAISNQIKEENYTYYFINKDGENIGYTGVSDKKDYLFLSKLYISKEYRGQGIGTKAFEFIKSVSNGQKIRLTVNKYNHNTISAYKKWGFKTIDSVVTDIGSGFVMDDYIMEYTS